MDWKQETALITGAGRGLGRALAREIASRGGKVVLVARNRQAIAEAVSEIRSTGGTAFGIAADVADIREVHPVLAQAAELAGPLTLLINNASTLGATPLRPWLETECEDLTHVLETNLIGPFRFTKAVLGSMLLRAHGTVVNISSDAAITPYPNWGAYSVSKAALHHLTQIWAEELRPSPVRFVSFDPGEMDTVMHADAIPEANRAELAHPSEVARRLLALLEDLK